MDTTDLFWELSLIEEVPEFEAIDEDEYRDSVAFIHNLVDLSTIDKKESSSK